MDNVDVRDAREIITALRNVFRNRRIADKFLKGHRIEYVKNKRKRVDYKCVYCENRFSRKDIVVDHIDPIIPVDRFITTWDEYINRLFHGELQALCKGCHDTKSIRENKLRKEFKKKAGVG